MCIPGAAEFPARDGGVCQWVKDGDPVGCRVQKRLIFVAEKTMVYDGYNELVHAVITVYKPTYTWQMPSNFWFPES